MKVNLREAGQEVHAEQPFGANLRRAWAQPDLDVPDRVAINRDVRQDETAVRI
jgi:hypothetical protein